MCQGGIGDLDHDENGRFYTRDTLCVWTNLGKHLLFVWLCVLSIKTDTRRIMRLEELYSILRLKRRTTDDSSSSLVPVFILRTHNQTNNKC